MLTCISFSVTVFICLLISILKNRRMVVWYCCWVRMVRRGIFTVRRKSCFTARSSSHFDSPCLFCFAVEYVWCLVVFFLFPATVFQKPVCRVVVVGHSKRHWKSSWKLLFSPVIHVPDFISLFTECATASVPPAKWLVRGLVFFSKGFIALCEF